jgi:alpha-galactosidase/6-phospho-beta-glucosidase family protein
VAPRIVVIGGGSFQWVPKLVCDLVNAPSLAEADLVLEDIAAEPLADMGDLARHLVARARVPMRVTTTTDQRAALEGADYVVVTISTGGFDSMRHDLAVPEKYGIKQAVGDTVGPGGVMRALRNVPVLVGIARDMEELCPDAWLLNITNPMTVLCRAVTRETSIATVGLCHEVTMAQSSLARLLDVDFDVIDPTVTGVNHLPLVTALGVDDADGFDLLRALFADDARRAEKHDVLRHNRVKAALFERFGVWPAAGDRHLVEFFPGFLTEESEWGRRWGVRLTTIEEREQWLDYFRAEFATLRGATEVPTTPSGEMVAPLLDAFLRDEPRAFPLNLPNTGQCPDIAPGPVVEAMCIVDGSGIRGRDSAAAPPLLAEWLRRIVASQEATVAAALSGNRDRVVDAMLLDPLAGRIDFERLEQMTDDMLATTAPWLPQFA